MALVNVCGGGGQFSTDDSSLFHPGREGKRIKLCMFSHMLKLHSGGGGGEEEKLFKRILPSAREKKTPVSH